MGQTKGPFPWVLIALWCSIPVGVVAGGILIAHFLLKGP